MILQLFPSKQQFGPIYVHNLRQMFLNPLIIPRQNGPNSQILQLPLLRLDFDLL